MASYFPSSSQPIAPTPSWVNPEFLHAFSSQGSLHDSYPELYHTTNDLDLPPNALRVLAQGQASGRLPVPLHNLARQHAGKADLAVVGNATKAQPHSKQAILKPVSVSAYTCGAPATQPVTQSPEATPHQSERVKVRARRPARVGKSKARKTVPVVSRIPGHTTSSWGDRTQSATLLNESTGATQAASAQGEATPPTAYVGPSSGAMPTVRPFPWATATAEEISRLPGLGSIPVDLIDLILPRLRRFVEDHDGPIGSDTLAGGNGRYLPATAGLLPVAQPVGSFPPATQPRHSPPMEQFETEFPMAEQYHEIGQPAAGLPTHEGLEELLQPQNENAKPKPVVDEPPSATLDYLLDLEHILGAEARQPENSVTPTWEVIERSPWVGSQNSNGLSTVGDGQNLGASGTETFGEFDMSDFNSWDEFAKL